MNNNRKIISDATSPARVSMNIKYTYIYLLIYYPILPVAQIQPHSFRQCHIAFSVLSVSEIKKMLIIPMKSNSTCIRWNVITNFTLRTSSFKLLKLLCISVIFFSIPLMASKIASKVVWNEIKCMCSYVWCIPTCLSFSINRWRLGFACQKKLYPQDGYL